MAVAREAVWSCGWCSLCWCFRTAPMTMPETQNCSSLKFGWMYGWPRRTALRRVSGGHQEVGLLGARTRLLLLAMYRLVLSARHVFGIFRTSRAQKWWDVNFSSQGAEAHAYQPHPGVQESNLGPTLRFEQAAQKNSANWCKFCPKSSLQAKNDVLEPKRNRGEQNEIEEIWARPRKRGKARQAEASRGRPRQTEGKPRAKPREAEASRGKPRLVLLKEEVAERQDVARGVVFVATSLLRLMELRSPQRVSPCPACCSTTHVTCKFGQSATSMGNATCSPATCSVVAAQ